MSSTVFERNPIDPELVTSSLSGCADRPYWFDTVTPPTYPTLDHDITTDLLIVGGGYTGLWSALRAKERNPNLQVTLIESHTIGWAASGRNGGFCEASLTHGHDNGMSRWPEEFDALERLGIENLDAIEETVARYAMDVEFERTGALTVATEQHQIEWVASSEDYLGEDAVRARVNSPTYLAGTHELRTCAMINPAKLAVELARVATELGVTIYEHTPAQRIRGKNTIVTAHARINAGQTILATNVFHSLLKRNRLMTVPVYDYVLMTEPLTATQLEAIGWSGREGISDLANQFHYYRLSADNRILFGGYDAVYYFGGKVREKYEHRPESWNKLAAHFFTTFPQLADVRFTHRWSGAIDSCSRFCAFFGTARGNRIAYAVGFTGLGVGASRFAADVMLDLLEGIETERTRLRMVREKPVPFPPEPAAAVGINLVRASLDRADHNLGKRNLFLRVLDALGMGFDS